MATVAESAELGVWARWMQRPRNTFLRRALFQIHLWLGIAFGLYIFVVSVTGSAIVFRNEMYAYFGQRPSVVATGEKLSNEALGVAARAAHPGYAIAYTFPSRRPTDVTEVWMNNDKGDQIQRLFNPYTGEDIGRSVSRWIVTVKWLGDLHTDLLGHDTGRKINGVGSILLTLLTVSGLIIWWPGVRQWKRNLGVDFRANWKRLNWDLHNAIGFWTFLLVFMWGFTGVYLVWPAPFQEIVNRVTPLELYKPLSQVEEPSQRATYVAAQITPAEDAPRPRRRRQPPRGTKGDQFLRWFYYLHFGNFAGAKTKGAWVALGLIPPLLFVTGTIMWWNRVVRRWRGLSAD